MLPRPMSETSTPIRWNRLSPYVRMATWMMEPPTSPPRTGMPIKKRPAMIRAFPTSADAAGSRETGSLPRQRVPPRRVSVGEAATERTDDARMISGQASFVKWNYGQWSSIVLLYAFRSESLVKHTLTPRRSAPVIRWKCFPLPHGANRSCAPHMCSAPRP